MRVSLSLIPRIDKAPHRDGRHRHDEQRRVVEDDVLVQPVRPDAAAQPVLAACDAGPAQADTPDQHAERQRQEQEIDTGSADREQPEQRGQ
jgi:hypothetical protein